MKPAIVIGCGKAGLAIVWSLGSQGIPVIALHFESQHVDLDIAQVSRYVSQSVRTVNPRTHPKEFVRFLLHKGTEWTGGLLIPVGDPALKVVSKARQALSRYYTVSAMDWQIISELLNKRKMYALAESLGIPVPKTFYPTSRASLEKLKNRLTFPCIIKPLESPEFFSRFKAKVFKVDSFEKMAIKFDLTSQAGIEVMISEIVPGEDNSLFQFSSYVSREGHLSAFAFTRKVRQTPPHFGVSRVIKTIDPVPELKDQATRILDSLSFRGIASFEFKRNQRTGEYVLIEINPRVFLFMNLLVRSGVNLPLVMYQDMAQKKKVIISNFERGFFWIDLFAEVKSLILHRRLEYWPLSYYIGPYRGSKCFAVLNFRDVKPLFQKVALLMMSFLSIFNRDGT